MLNKYDKLLNYINNEMKNKKKLVVAIDGPCASGKSTLANYLKQKFNGQIIKMDDFFLPEELKTDIRLLEVGGNIYYERFYKDVIAKLLKKEPFTYSPYNCQTNEMDEDITINNNHLIIVEGVYSMRAEFLKAYNLKIFLDIDYNLQISRLEKRSPYLLNTFKTKWIPMENNYFNYYNLKNNVDFYVKT